MTVSGEQVINERSQKASGASSEHLCAITQRYGNVARSVFFKSLDIPEIDTAVIVNNYMVFENHREVIRETCKFSVDPDGPKKLGMIRKASDMIEGAKVRVKSPTSIAYGCSYMDAILFKIAINHPELEVTTIDLALISSTSSEACSIVD